MLRMELSGQRRNSICHRAGNPARRITHNGGQSGDCGRSEGKEVNPFIIVCLVWVVVAIIFLIVGAIEKKSAFVKGVFLTLGLLMLAGTVFAWFTVISN